MPRSVLKSKLVMQPTSSDVRNVSAAAVTARRQESSAPAAVSAATRCRDAVRALWARYADAIAVVVLAIIAGWTFLQFDITQQPLPGDTTYHIYSAQQMLLGHPIYRDVAIVKTPLADFITLFALPIGRALNIDDVMSARLVFFLLSIATVVVVYLAGRVLLDSRAAGVIAALVVAGNDFFGIRAVTGPEPKTLVALFALAALLFLAQRRWFWAGVCASLAALAWQPAAITMALVLGGALLAPVAEPSAWRAHTRWLVTLRAVVGMALPFLALIIYLGANGALGAAYGSTIGANLSHLGNQTAHTPLNELVEWNAYWVAYNVNLYCIAPDARWQIVVGVLGFGSMLAAETLAAVRRKRELFNLRRTPLLLYTLGFGAFTLLDFNWCPDLYPFLSVFGLGIGWFVAMAAKGVGEIAVRANHSARGRVLALALCLLAALGVFMVNVLDVRAYHRTGISYRDQLDLVHQVRMRADPGDRILSIGNAIILVEMHLPNASNIIHFGSKAGRGVLENESGGMDGMVVGLDQNPPRFVTLSRAQRQDWNEDFYEWLDSRYRLVIRDKYNAVDVYVLRKRAR
jgi:hypothetical protein